MLTFLTEVNIGWARVKLIGLGLGNYFKSGLWDYLWTRLVVNWINACLFSAFGVKNVQGPFV